MEVTLQKSKYDPGIDDPLYSSLLLLWESRMELGAEDELVGLDNKGRAQE